MPLASPTGCYWELWEAQHPPFIFSCLKSLPFNTITIFHQFSPHSGRSRQTHSPLPPSVCVYVTQAFVIIARQHRSQPQPSWGQGRTRVDVISCLSVSQWWAICFPSYLTNSSLTTLFFVQPHLVCIRVKKSDWLQTFLIQLTSCRWNVLITQDIAKVL